MDDVESIATVSDDLWVAISNVAVATLPSSGFVTVDKLGEDADALDFRIFTPVADKEIDGSKDGRGALIAEELTCASVG